MIKKLLLFFHLTFSCVSSQIINYEKFIAESTDLEEDLIILRKSKLIKLKNSLLFLLFSTLFLFSNPLISNKLVKYIEAPYLPVKLSQVPESDYIVVLSGMVHFVKDNVYEWSDPDRFFAGIKLLNANKGRKIIFPLEISRF